jgi:hypothetical protein
MVQCPCSLHHSTDRYLWALVYQIVPVNRLIFFYVLSLHHAGLVWKLTMLNDLMGMQESQLVLKLYCPQATAHPLIGYHRLWSHRSYVASFSLRCFLLIGGASTVQGSCYWWLVGIAPITATQTRIVTRTTPNAACSGRTSAGSSSLRIFAQGFRTSLISATMSWFSSSIVGTSLSLFFSDTSSPPSFSESCGVTGKVDLILLQHFD